MKHVCSNIVTQPSFWFTVWKKKKNRTKQKKIHVHKFVFKTKKIILRNWIWNHWSARRFSSRGASNIIEMSMRLPDFTLREMLQSYKCTNTWITCWRIFTPFRANKDWGNWFNTPCKAVTVESLCLLYYLSLFLSVPYKSPRGYQRAGFFFCVCVGGGGGVCVCVCLLHCFYFDMSCWRMNFDTISLSIIVVAGVCFGALVYFSRAELPQKKKKKKYLDPKRYLQAPALISHTNFKLVGTHCANEMYENKVISTCCSQSFLLVYVTWLCTYKKKGMWI